MRRKNPYIVLGLPFGATRDEANIAFARKAKTVARTAPDRKERIADLTWALHQIDESLTNPSAALDIYRVPADPNGYRSTVVGLFAPPPEPFPTVAAGLSDPAALHERLRLLVRIRANELGDPQP